MTQEQKTRVYFAPFHAMSDSSAVSPCGPAAAFKKAVTLQDWPYDNGDDPSFYATRKFGGQLSWGICRQDVRNCLRPGDIVVFFSFRKFKEAGHSEYRLCALATVERSVSQIDIWRDNSLQSYRRYFNLLIRPSKSAHDQWEHFEPTLEGSRLHHDWLWRIADHRGLRKEDFQKIEESNRFGPGTAVRGNPIVVKRNYVLFLSGPTQTHILSNPPVVAFHSKGEPAEEWNRDKFSQAVKRLTLDVAERASGRTRSLRIRNSQRAHRHIVFELPRPDAETWRAEFVDLLKKEVGCLRRKMPITEKK